MCDMSLEAYFYCLGAPKLGSQRLIGPFCFCTLCICFRLLFGRSKSFSTCGLRALLYNNFIVLTLFDADPEEDISTAARSMPSAMPVQGVYVPTPGVITKSHGHSAVRAEY